MIRVVVTDAPLDAAAELAALEVAGAGGVASFTGLVRADDGVTALELEHYPGATEAALSALAEQARDRWALLATVVVHRVGRMVPSDRVVFVGTAAAHRQAALEACAFLIDRLKTEAPFWKREVLPDGARWVEARATDDDAAARWADPIADRPASA
ncbi:MULTISPECIES: molybdenum cofactor biosynthesis protein MoaE [Sphingomonas]|uniref:molybdenum cofactor biosynthesis protein MoaE n=1 Tax=Sphingomonas TaxID=13687 RepID=UPI00082F0613|nr:molybdenum cofactor biosynthesis protein MoaE [Sphingomonas sp. CCH10-B3]